MSADPFKGSRVFVDTNVLIYAFDASADIKRVQAVELLQEIWETDNGCVSVQVLQEFYVNATRKPKRPLTADTTMRIVASLSRWEVHAPNAEDLSSGQRIAGVAILNPFVLPSR